MDWTVSVAIKTRPGAAKFCSPFCFSQHNNQATGVPCLYQIIILHTGTCWLARPTQISMCSLD